MKEFVKANGRIFECINVENGTDSISMEVASQDAAGLESFFESVSSLTTHFEAPMEPEEGQEAPALEEPHGSYSHLRLNFVNKNTINGSVVIVMKIKSETERRLDALEERLETQDGAITEIGKAALGEAQWQNLMQAGLKARGGTSK